MLSSPHTFYNALVLALTTAGLFLSWWNIVRERPELRGDRGILYMACGFATWFCLTLLLPLPHPTTLIGAGLAEQVQFFAYYFGINALSSLNNLFFLWAYPYFEYSAKEKTLFGKRLFLGGPNWQKGTALLFFGTVLATTFLLFAFPGSDAHFVATFVDFLFSTVTVWLIAGAMRDTFSIRQYPEFAALSAAVLGGMWLYQFLFFIPGLDRIVQENPAAQQWVSGASIAFKLVFAYCLIYLAGSWEKEQLNLPDPEKMRLEFGGRKPDNSAFTVFFTVDKRFRRREVHFSPTLYKGLVSFAVARIKAGHAPEQGWLQPAQFGGYNPVLSRILERLTLEKLAADRQLEAPRLKAMLNEKDPLFDPRLARQHKRLQSQYLPVFFENDNGARRLRIPPEGIHLSADVFFNLLLLQEKSKTRLERNELTALLADLQLILKLDPEIVQAMRERATV